VIDRTASKLAALVCAVILLAGCADFKTYMRDRGNDLADCFTLRVGTCYGLGARAQLTNFLGVSVLGCIEQKQVGYFGREPVRVKDGVSVGMPVPQVAAPFLGAMVALGIGKMPSNPAAGLKTFLTGFPCTDVRVHGDASLPQAYALLGVNGAEFVGAEKLPFLDPDERMVPATPFLREKFFVEIGAQLFYVCFDIGFNPVEFVDFLLGWSTLDISGDDAYNRPQAAEEEALP
jgi:hypothetical protein